MGAKNILLIVIALLIVCGAFFLAEYRNKQVAHVSYTATVSTTTDLISPDLQNQDSDGDGLKDWEEVLLGTDPHNPDTDGDGTPDGKEVQLGRNPLVKGPNDKMTGATTTASVTDENLTPTDKFARDFFARYMELNQMGLSGDPVSQKELIGKVLASGTVIATPKTYTSKDISVKSDTSPASLTKYGNDIGTVFKLFSVESRNETVIAKDAIDKSDPSILKELDPVITSDKNILNGLLKTKVPQTMARMHLDLINGVSEALFVADSLRKSDTDNLLGLQGTSLYIDAIQKLSDAFSEIRNYYKSLGISFAPTDPGILFSPQ